jgi:HlyD family secretion protein
MKISTVVLVLFIVFALSCARKGENLVTYSLKRSDFSDLVTVRGTVQAVVNIPVMPPSGNDFWGIITVKKLAADGNYVKKGDTICLLSYPELESNFRDGITTLDSLEAALHRAVADSALNIALLEAQLATSEAGLKISSLDSLRLSYAAPAQRKLLELGMQKAVIENAKAAKKLKASKAISEADIRQIKSRIIQQRSRTGSLEEQMKSLTITAVRDGLVMRITAPKFSIMSSTGVGTLGGPIKEGSVIFMDNPVLQFPDMDKMQVSAAVAEADFKKISPGQKVRILVEASDNLVTTGKVNRKSLISRTDQMYSDINVRFYEVIVDIDSCHNRMKPGLSASCEITLSEAADTLVVPTLAVFDSDSMKVVYARKGDRYQPVEVKTGLSGSSYTVISSGLKGDEVIALTLPPARMLDTEVKKIHEGDSMRTH